MTNDIMLSTWNTVVNLGEYHRKGLTDNFSNSLFKHLYPLYFGKQGPGISFCPGEIH